jgi:hypothetical protein
MMTCRSSQRLLLVADSGADGRPVRQKLQNAVVRELRRDWSHTAAEHTGNAITVRMTVHARRQIVLLYLADVANDDHSAVAV